MTVHEQIRQQAEPLMSAFQTDLEHDRKWIEDNPGKPFIHVTRATGTHVIGLPEGDSLLDDEPVPHLFGMARPSEIQRQMIALMKGQLSKSGKLWLVYDGKAVRKRSAEKCVEIFEGKLRVAERRAAKTRLAAA